MCGWVEDVQGVLTLFCSGAAQVVCHALRVEELREQLEVDEEDGDRQEEEEEVESGEANQRECAMDGMEMTVNALRSRAMRCACIITDCGTKMRAVSMHVRHASVEVQVQCVNVVIGVVLGELLVVRVVPIFVCDDAVVHRTLVLIAVYRSHCFHVAVSVAIFLYLEV